MIGHVVNPTAVLALVLVVIADISDRFGAASVVGMRRVGVPIGASDQPDVLAARLGVEGVEVLGVAFRALEHARERTSPCPHSTRHIGLSGCRRTPNGLPQPSARAVNPFIHAGLCSRPTDTRHRFGAQKNRSERVIRAEEATPRSARTSLRLPRARARAGNDASAGTPHANTRSNQLPPGITHFAGSVQEKRAAWNAGAAWRPTPVVPRGAL